MDDLISRQAAIDAVNVGCKEWRGIFERCKEKLLALSSAQPERTGKWIITVNHYKDDEQEFYYNKAYCSTCGIERRIGWGNVNYCPNCGVRMVEVDES